MINISNKDALALARLLPAITQLAIRQAKSTREMNNIRVLGLINERITRKIIRKWQAQKAD